VVVVSVPSDYQDARERIRRNHRRRERERREEWEFPPDEFVTAGELADNGGEDA
jgi:hypothetical protein